jgi:hypothetical protein
MILHSAAASSSASTGIRSNAMNMAPATDSASDVGFSNNFEFGVTPPDGTTATRSARGRTAPTPTDCTAATHPAGGRTAPALTNSTTATRSAEGCTAPNDVIADSSEFVVTPIADRNAMRPALPTMLELFARAIKQLPDLEEPVDLFLWQETFMRQACLADTAMADSLQSRRSLWHG